MILLVIICIASGYIVGISVNAKTHKRKFINYNTDLRRSAIEVCVNWQAAKNANDLQSVGKSMLKLSSYLGLQNETEKQTFN